MPEERPFVTPAELSKALKLPKSWLRERTKDGLIPAVGVAPGSYRYDLASARQAVVDLSITRMTREMRVLVREHLKRRSVDG